MSTLAVSPLNLEQRTAKDVCFGVTYVILLVATCAIAAYCYSTSSDNLVKLRSCAGTNSTDAGHFQHVMGSVAATLRDEPTADKTLSDLIALLPYLSIPAVGAVLLGVCWMALLRWAAKEMVYVTLMAKGVILIGAGVYLSSEVKSACGLTEGDCTAAYSPLILVAVGVLYFLMIWCWRSRIELTAKLIEQAVRVVAAHPGVFAAAALLLAVKVALLVLALAAALLLFASQVVVHQNTPQPGMCEFDWRASNADEAMYLVVAVFLYWTVQFWLCVRFFVVSLVTGVWYYRTESLASQEGAVTEKRITKAPVLTALGLGLSKSFGSIAQASLLLTICEMLRRMANRERRNGLLGCLIACCIGCLLSYLEFLTKFALTVHALTGDSFCDSGRTFLHHCQRHGFKALVVDFLAALTLQFGAIVLGLLLTAATVFLAGRSSHVHDDDKTAVLTSLGGVTWLIAGLILCFIAGILLNVVDAAYACLVLDCDHATHTGAHHQPVMAQVILVKAHPTYVIQQPGGTTSLAHPVYAQGIPVAADYPHPQPPPPGAANVRFGSPA